MTAESLGQNKKLEWCPHSATVIAADSKSIKFAIDLSRRL